ncbi:MAG TPA: hypothetical protein VNL17_14335 [Verrucomicrobiae bacterium]|nr:hypothetical protein [Verrucomicrobiae bacterium]
MDFNNIPTAAAITMFGAVAAGPVLAAFNSWLANRNAKRAADAAKLVADALKESHSTTDVKLAEIHTLVNSRLTEALDYIHKLEVLLRDATGRPVEGEPHGR